MTSVIGWDIGGANLKAARAENGVVVAAVAIGCAPHEGLANVEAAIRAAAGRLGAADRHGVTMTAELSDAFENRARGVVSIAAMFRREAQAPDALFYAGDAGFIARGGVEAAAASIASANWRASAALVARRCAAALFVDMGSTTTDIIPIASGKIAALGPDDSGRLAQGELVYAGFSRGAPQAYARLAPIDGRWSPLVNEAFGSMADARRLLGGFDESVDLAPTADGRARTVEASRARLARLVGRDDLEPAAARAFAAFLLRAQMRAIEDAIALLASRGAFNEDAPIVGAGVGRGDIALLAARQGRDFLDFADFLPAAPTARRAAADCAPAAAIALLLSE